MAKLVAVTACPTGIAHTFMAAEALRRAALSAGHDIRVETQGSVGTADALSPGEIAAADGVILATDVRVDGEEIEDARWFTRDELGASAEDGSLVLPGGVSISHYLIEWWYGAHLPGSWR